MPLSSTPDRRFILHRDLWTGWREPAPVRTTLKPAGMWYGLGDAWLEWCRAEQPGWIHRYISEVRIDLSKMKVIRSLEEFDAFEVQWIGNGLASQIDWRPVMAEYSGLEIAPYLWERRLSSIWYYIWDCASGVIWREDALVSRTLIGQTEGAVFSEERSNSALR